MGLFCAYPTQAKVVGFHLLRGKAISRPLGSIRLVRNDLLGLVGLCQDISDQESEA